MTDVVTGCHTNRFKLPAQKPAPQHQNWQTSETQKIQHKMKAFLVLALFVVASFSADQGFSGYINVNETRGALSLCASSNQPPLILWKDTTYFIGPSILKRVHLILSYCGWMEVRDFFKLLICDPLLCFCFSPFLASGTELYANCLFLWDLIFLFRTWSEFYPLWSPWRKWTVQGQPQPSTSTKPLLLDFCS